MLHWVSKNDSENIRRTYNRSKQPGDPPPVLDQNSPIALQLTMGVWGSLGIQDIQTKAKKSKLLEIVEPVQ